MQVWQRSVHGRWRIGIILAGALLAASQVAAAATPARTEDERLVDGLAPPDSHLGSTVALSTYESLAFALAGAPQGGTWGTGGLAKFVHSWGSGWAYDSTHNIALPGTQPFPLDVAGPRGVTAIRTDDDSTKLRWHTVDGQGIYFDVPGPVVEAVAFHWTFLAVGQPDAVGDRGLVKIYEPQGGDLWTLEATYIGAAAGDRLGSALAAADGILVAGAPGYGDNGAVYAYVRGGSWLEWQRLDSPASSQSGAKFGAAVDIQPDGSWIAVGSPKVDRVTSPGAAVDIGAVYLYESSGLGWVYADLLRPVESEAHDHFGTSVALRDPVLVAGAPDEDAPLFNEGAAYVYQRSGSQWQPRLRLVHSGAELGDRLGASVAVGDLGALVGAPYTDVDGVQNQGAAFFYRGVISLFADGFESGDTSAWSSTVP